MRYGSVDGGASGLLPYDAHIRTGVTFWARIGDTSANKVRLSVSDKYSRPEGGICDASASATTSTACYDTFGVDLLPLSQTWTQYRVPFGGLGQRGFGLHGAVGARYQQHLYDSVRPLPQRDLRLLAGRHLFLLDRPAAVAENAPISSSRGIVCGMSETDKRKQSLYFPEAMLKEISAEATRQDRSLSWIVQKAWKAARKEFKNIPSVDDAPGGGSDEGASEDKK